MVLLPSPLEFFHRHCGSIIASDLDPLGVLMRAYPHADPNKTTTTRMGGSEPARFLVSEQEAGVWAPVRLPDHAQAQLRTATTSERKKRDWIIDVLMSPPKPPFLAVSIGMAASDVEHWRYTVSEEMIVFSGAASTYEGQNVLAVDRAKFLAAKEWFSETGTPVSDLLRANDIRERFQRGMITGAAARQALARIKTPQAAMKTYPGVQDAVVMKLASYAANEWVPV